jgi:hypothetical protein
MTADDDRTRAVVVTYQVRPEARDEHVQLINAVFDQLADEQPADVDYTVVCLDDGVSFIHVSVTRTDDGSNPLVALAAFAEFSGNVSDRTVDPPHATPAQVIGRYRPPGRSID